jgi:hypothetical protein
LGRDLRWCIGHTVGGSRRVERTEGAVMVRVVLATSNIFISLVLGALAMGAVWYIEPEMMQRFFQWASGAKAWIVNRGLDAKYNNFMWFLIEDRQLVYMGFVMATRIALAMLTSTFAYVFARGDLRRL